MISKYNLTGTGKTLDEARKQITTEAEKYNKLLTESKLPELQRGKEYYELSGSYSDGDEKGTFVFQGVNLTLLKSKIVKVNRNSEITKYNLRKAYDVSKEQLTVLTTGKIMDSANTNSRPPTSGKRERTHIDNLFY